MRRSRPTLLDYTLNAIGVLFTLWFIAIGHRRGWSTILTIGLLVVASIPIALALLWLKRRLRSRSGNVH